MTRLLVSTPAHSVGVLFASIWVCGLQSGPLCAQVPPQPVDTNIVETTRAPLNLGTQTTQTIDPATNVTTTAITGGTRPSGGPNLFHSFDSFSVGSNDIAHFQNDMVLPTTNIITRVVGDAQGVRQASTIDGILRTNNPLSSADPLNFGEANLFLVNPSGVIFGPNAQLDIKGSFAATTADHLRMADGAQFHADPLQPSLLSVADVASFGFTSPRPVGITVESGMLAVAASKTMSLIGGDFTMTDASLEAPGGQIQIVSVASAGNVLLNQAGEPQSVDVSSFSQLGAVSLEGTGNRRSTITVNGTTNPQVGAGAIVIRGDRMSLRNSDMTAATGNADSVPMGIDLQLRTNTTFSNSAVATSTTGNGRGGNIRVSAPQIELNDLASVTTETVASGRAGNIGVASDQLRVTGGARIEANTRGVGNAGNITVTNTDSVTVSGLSADGSTRSGIFAKTQSGGGSGGGGGGGTGSGGSGGGGSGSNEGGSGSGSGGGSDGESGEGGGGGSGSGGGGNGSGSGGGSGGGGGQDPTIGNAGDILITARRFDLSDGAQIDSSTTTAGSGGRVTVNADSITVTGVGTRLTSDASRGNGTGGDIDLSATTIGIQDSARVTATTDGTGNAGDITMTARERISVDSGGTVTTSTRGSGAGGTILINAPYVLVRGPGTSIRADTLRPFADLSVGLNILHPNDGDLNLRLESPKGTRIALLSGVGGTGDDFTGTILDDQGSVDIASGTAPFTGVFRPREPLAQLIGEPAAGEWTLNIRDQANGNSGTLQNWTLRIGTESFQSTGGAAAIPDNGTVLSTVLMAAPMSSVVQGAGEASGIGGDVTINAQTVAVQNGATVSATTRGSGRGGSLIVHAARGVDLAGPGSGLFTDSEGSGAGGDINVQASRMVMANGATVSAASSEAGDAGTVVINAGSEFLSNNSFVTTEALKASGGNITVIADDRIHLINSGISSSVFGGPLTAGGNILIDPNFILLQDSRIVAQAIQGAGGNINLVFNRAFLADARSTISASSQFGLSGTVNFNSPTQYLGRALVPVKQNVLTAKPLLNQLCAARLAEGLVSTFVVMEHEGLPAEPGGLLISSLPNTWRPAEAEDPVSAHSASISRSISIAANREFEGLSRADGACRP